MSFGFETPEEFMELVTKHMDICYQGYEKIYMDGMLPLDKYIDRLRKADAVIHVYEYYNRLRERGEITENREQELLIERAAYLKKRLTQLNRQKGREKRTRGVIAGEEYI